MTTLNALNLNVNWELTGLGTVDSSNVQAARWQARQARLKADKELVTVLQQVRTSLLQSLDTERNIFEASDEVASAAEELRLAQLRFANGLGAPISTLSQHKEITLRR